MTREEWVQCEHCGAEYRSQTAADGCCANETDTDDDDRQAVADGGSVPSFCAVDAHGSVSVVVSWR